MKKLIWLVMATTITFSLSACCKCMNCPGFAQATGGSSDKICQEDYETAQASNPSSNQMTWVQYSDYMLQTGCTCVE